MSTHSKTFNFPEGKIQFSIAAMAGEKRERCILTHVTAGTMESTFIEVHPNKKWALRELQAIKEHDARDFFKTLVRQFKDDLSLTPNS